jgi:molecular chaperone GrpE
MSKQKKQNTKKKESEKNIKDVQNNQNHNNNQQESQQDMPKEEQNIIAELEQKLKEEKDRYLRLYAEFENYRKRTAKEKLEMFETASEGVIKNLLPILDDFERAIAEMNKNKDDEMAKGVSLIYDKFKKTLEKEGLKHIEVNKGDTFDPEVHEAIAQMPVEDENMKDKVVDIVEKGYKLGTKNIRYPKVVTGR